MNSFKSANNHDNLRFESNVFDMDESSWKRANGLRSVQSLKRKAASTLPLSNPGSVTAVRALTWVWQTNLVPLS
jgi:hypothetical protein